MFLCQKVENASIRTTSIDRIKAAHGEKQCLHESAEESREHHEELAKARDELHEYFMNENEKSFNKILDILKSNIEKKNGERNKCGKTNGCSDMERLKIKKETISRLIKKIKLFKRPHEGKTRASLSQHKTMVVCLPNLLFTFQNQSPLLKTPKTTRLP